MFPNAPAMEGIFKTGSDLPTHECSSYEF